MASEVKWKRGNFQQKEGERARSYRRIDERERVACTGLVLTPTWAHAQDRFSRLARRYILTRPLFLSRKAIYTGPCVCVCRCVGKSEQAYVRHTSAKNTRAHSRRVQGPELRVQVHLEISLAGFFLARVVPCLYTHTYTLIKRRVCAHIQAGSLRETPSFSRYDFSRRYSARIFQVSHLRRYFSFLCAASSLALGAFFFFAREREREGKKASER